MRMSLITLKSNAVHIDCPTVHDYTRALQALSVLCAKREKGITGDMVSINLKLTDEDLIITFADTEKHTSMQISMYYYDILCSIY